MKRAVQKVWGMSYNLVRVIFRPTLLSLVTLYLFLQSFLQERWLFLFLFLFPSLQLFFLCERISFPPSRSKFLILYDPISSGAFSTPFFLDNFGWVSLESRFFVKRFSVDETKSFQGVKNIQPYISLIEWLRYEFGCSC